MSKFSHLPIGGPYTRSLVEKSNAIKSVQKSVLHERKYNLSKIKVAFCTNFLWLPCENFPLFCTRAKVPNFHSGVIKKIVQKNATFFSRNSYS